MTGQDYSVYRRTAADQRICVLIPTYNNVSTLNDVVEGVLRYVADVIVVNDGSTDDTESVLKRFDGRIKVVSYCRNRGKGYALKQGFKVAKEAGFRYVVTIDSDGQHRPSDLPAFILAIVRNPGRMIVGTRDLSKVEIKGSSSFANRFSNFWFCIQTGLHLSDTQTGYRAYPLDRVKHWFPVTDRYEAELAIMVFLRWNGTGFVEIPIDVYYPPASERVSHFRSGMDFSRIAMLNTCLCIGAVMYGLPSVVIRFFVRRNPFNFEFRPFTRRNGIRREAALTLGRLGRSLFSIMAFAFFAIFLFMPYTALFFLIGRTTPEKKMRYHRQICALARFASRNLPGASLTVDNPKGETFGRPAVIVCNHQSHLDLSSILSITPRMVFLTNDWVWHNPFYGYAIHKADFCPVSKGIGTVMPKLKDLVARGYSIAVFPEGTRSPDGTVHRFHKGAFHVARELGLDIIPMTLHGAWQLLPKTDFMLRRGPVHLSVGDRIQNTELGGMTTMEIASLCRRIISERLSEMSEKIENCNYAEPFVRYRYAYRGWNIVSRVSVEIKRFRRHYPSFDRYTETRKVCFLNAATGVIPLIFALANRHVDVTGMIDDERDFITACDTASLPRNLKYVRSSLSETLDGVKYILILRSAVDRYRYGSFNPEILDLTDGKE